MNDNEHHNITMTQLSSYIFLKNRFNKKIVIDIKKGLSNTNDLFHLCLDLFCKGIVLMHGYDGKIELNNLTIDDLSVVVTKLENANIRTNINIQNVNEMIEKSIINTSDPRDIITCSLNYTQSCTSENLDDYEFRLIIDDNLYLISFEIIE